MHDPVRLIDAKGKKQVGGLVAAERGKLVTLVCAINALGNSIPPMFIFSRKRFQVAFISGAPANSVGVCSKSGWINVELCLEFLKHFVKSTKCSKDSPVLLIIDNHNSHI